MSWSGSTSEKSVLPLIYSLWCTPADIRARGRRRGADGFQASSELPPCLQQASGPTCSTGATLARPSGCAEEGYGASGLARVHLEPLKHLPDRELPVVDDVGGSADRTGWCGLL